MNTTRQPAGRPTGGQFAAHTLAEAEVALGHRIEAPTNDSEAAAVAAYHAAHQTTAEFVLGPDPDEQRPAKLDETLARRRGHAFYPRDMRTWPALYSTENTPAAEKPIVARYFSAGGTWWIAEVDQKTGEAFGYAELAINPGGGEWGYIPLTELEKLTIGPFVGVERDLDFEPGTLAREAIPALADR